MRSTRVQVAFNSALDGHARSDHEFAKQHLPPRRRILRQGDSLYFGHYADVGYERGIRSDVFDGESPDEFRE